MTVEWCAVNDCSVNMIHTSQRRMLLNCECKYFVHRIDLHPSNWIASLFMETQNSVCCQRFTSMLEHICLYKVLLMLWVNNWNKVVIDTREMFEMPLCHHVKKKKTLNQSLWTRPEKSIYRHRKRHSRGSKNGMMEKGCISWVFVTTEFQEAEMKKWWKRCVSCDVSYVWKVFKNIS